MDIYDSNVLLRVVEDLKRPQTFLLGAFFPEVQNSDVEKISFDMDNGKRRIAPFCSPLVEGKVVESRGHKTDTFEPTNSNGENLTV